MYHEGFCTEGGALSQDIFEVEPGFESDRGLEDKTINSPLISKCDFFKNKVKMYLAQHTLKISDHDFVIIRTCEQIVCTGTKANRTDVAGVRTVCLNRSATSDVIEHATTVLQSGGH